MKIAPILRAFRNQATVRLIHSGQHYDDAMSTVFFDELRINPPDVNLEVGSGTGTEQIAHTMLRLEPVLAANGPDALLVVGDVNATIAGALVASRQQIALIHVEAGLRSFDRSMPEELNRLVTDRLSDLLLTTERSASSQLLSEGIKQEQIRFVGNVMIDTLYENLPRAVAPRRTVEKVSTSVIVDWENEGYGFVTLHRPSNVDSASALGNIISGLIKVSQNVPLIFSVHPRTKARIIDSGFQSLLANGRIIMLPPASYLETIGLVRDAKLVITDSGGLQEETTALGVPCLTVRDNTERPITVVEGTNTLVGQSAEALINEARSVIETGGKRGRVPELWDGKTAQRIVSHVVDFIDRRKRSVKSSA